MQNTVSLAFGRDFFRAGGDGELVPQCSYVEKNPVMQMIKGKRVVLHLPTQLLGQIFQQNHMNSLFMSESKVFCFQNEISPPQKSAIEPEESKLSLTDVHIIYLLV